MSGNRFYLNIRHKIRHLLHPALCQMCGIPCATGQFYCTSCRAAMPRVTNPCRLCGLPCDSGDQLCATCRLHPPRWRRMIAPLAYRGPVRQQIHLLKYSNRIDLAEGLLQTLNGCFQCDGIDALIPVPLHLTRLRERGFNQSAEIARVLARQLDLPLDRHSLQRVRATQPQAGLSPNQRRNNVRAAFHFEPDTRYRRIALIDDIITSGSTMDALTRLLLRSGVERVEVWSLARALKPD
jgi:ComF family protein